MELRPEWNEIRAAEEGAESLQTKTNGTETNWTIKLIATEDKTTRKKCMICLARKNNVKELTANSKTKINFKIAIVVDMWLTGFDVPFLDSIYIDKPIQRHNLIQTISRVNRKFEGKTKGW